ncbi:MAG TPA: C45 family peptidase [Solirubrobacteraceae bacterium]|nr:C45 family peptidase [Solirubrobacteraceae bacterium]
MDRVRTFCSPSASPHDRGEAFGAANASDVGATYERYAELFDAVAGRSAAGRPVELRPLGEEALAAIAAYSAAAESEIRGIAGGAGLEPWQLAALNARTEILARLGAPARGECSTVVDLRGRRSPLTIQTWDWHDTLADGWFAWTIDYPDGRVVHTVTEYGILAKIGVSSRGVGVHMNILQHARDGGPIGAPVHILARAVLEGADDPGAALALLGQAETSASTVLTIIGASEGGSAVAGAELSPDGPRYVLPDAGGLYLHTNHFLDPHLAAHDRAPRLGPDSYLRLDVLRRALHDRPAADLDELVHRLADHSAGPGSVCCHAADDAPLADRWATLATVGLDVAKGDLSVRRGGPCDERASWHRCRAGAAAPVG